MRNTTNASISAVRRTGRDRRDAGTYRQVRRAERAQDLARSEARKLKVRALAWYGGVGPSLPPCEIARSVEHGPALFPEHGIVGASHNSAGGRVGSDVAPATNDTVPTDRVWLPEAGGATVVEGIRITAMPVAGAPGHPFYVLARAD